MGRKAEQNRLTTGANGVQLEQSTIYDDNLLPAADELAKLHALDNDIIPWIKERTEIEQNARVRFNERRTALAFREINYSAALTFLGMAFCFAIICGFGYGAYHLVMAGHENAGLLLGGGDIVGMLMVISKFRMRKDK